MLYAGLHSLLLFDVDRKHPTEEHSYDMVIIGGGIVGAATARELQTRYPMLKCAIVEKEDGFGELFECQLAFSAIYLEPKISSQLCRVIEKYRCNLIKCPFSFEMWPKWLHRIVYIYLLIVYSCIVDVTSVKGLRQT